jgi:hypothetical protein
MYQSPQKEILSCSITTHYSILESKGDDIEYNSDIVCDTDLTDITDNVDLNTDTDSNKDLDNEYLPEYYL